MRRNNTTPRDIVATSRRGSMAPAMMVALVVVISVVALTLDRIWLQAAQGELLTAAETAALGAGRHLASDDLLKLESDPEVRIARARSAAVEVASTNQIAGQSVQLDASTDGDVRFGRLLTQESTGRVIFVETPYKATSVVVRATHSRARYNPVATFFHGLTGAEGADVAAQAEATIDNRIPGFEPLEGAPIPLLPLAILRSASEDSETESWQTCIDDRRGRDEFGYDEATGEVVYESDGIPEIVLRPCVLKSDPEEANAHLIVPHADTTIPELVRQVSTGWNREDMSEDLTQLRVDAEPHSFNTVADIPGPVFDELPALIGECRIVMLYDDFEMAGRRSGRVKSNRFAAGRIMSLKFEDDQCHIVFQPGVMTTRSAILADETDTSAAPEQLANAYIYKLRLTH